MKLNPDPLRHSYVIRPIILAIVLTSVGELLIFLIWGLELIPGSALATKAIWTAACGVAMGAVICAFVTLLVTGRLTGSSAKWTAGFVYGQFQPGFALFRPVRPAEKGGL